MNNKKIIEKYFLEMWNERKPELLDELLTDDYIHHKPDGSTVVGKIHVANVLKWVFENYPDIIWSIKFMVAEDNMVSTFIEGHAKSPKEAYFKEVFYHKIENGKIIEGWVLSFK